MVNRMTGDQARSGRFRRRLRTPHPLMAGLRRRSSAPQPSEHRAHPRRDHRRHDRSRAARSNARQHSWLRPYPGRSSLHSSEWSAVPSCSSRSPSGPSICAEVSASRRRLPCAHVRHQRRRAAPRWRHVINDQGPRDICERDSAPLRMVPLTAGFQEPCLASSLSSCWSSQLAGLAARSCDCACAS
jgi:hypothetical protein